MSDGDSPSAATNRGRLGRGHSVLIGALISTVVLLAIAGDDARQSLRYERSAVMAGQWWRLLTGHFVHYGIHHLSLNLVGMGLIAALFGRDYGAPQWLWILFCSVLAIDIGFVFYEPQMDWYVGFSGVLHGAIAAGIVAWWRYENRLFTLSIAALFIVKLCWEQYRGALPLSGDMPVAVDAHLYGAIGGTLAAASIAIWRQSWPRRATSL
jgi:rhomboid family GlyGly-CTERM serine protease